MVPARPSFSLCCYNEYPNSNWREAYLIFDILDVHARQLRIQSLYLALEPFHFHAIALYDTNFTALEVRPLPSERKKVKVSNVGGSVRTCTAPHAKTWPGKSSQEWTHRYHYRAVREEVATPVWQIDNLEHALIAYRDSLKGQLMLIFTGSVFN